MSEQKKTKKQQQEEKTGSWPELAFLIFFFYLKPQGITLVPGTKDDKHAHVIWPYFYTHAHVCLLANGSLAASVHTLHYSMQLRDRRRDVMRQNNVLGQKEL